MSWLFASRGQSISSAQSLSCVQLFVTPQTAACQASLSVTNSRSLLKLTSFKSVMPSNQLILCHPLLLLPSILPSIRGFFSLDNYKPQYPTGTCGNSLWCGTIGHISGCLALLVCKCQSHPPRPHPCNHKNACPPPEDDSHILVNGK